MPPGSGWTLPEAARALFPDEFRRCEESDNPHSMFAFLAVDLLRAIRNRPDLRISGIERGRPFGGRVRFHADLHGSGTFLSLNILAETFRVGTGANAHFLDAVRIERASVPPIAETGHEGVPKAKRGRRNAHEVAMALFEARRKRNAPLGRSKEDDAAAILVEWPADKGAPMLPQEPSVARWIARRWREEDRKQHK